MDQDRLARLAGMLSKQTGKKQIYPEPKDIEINVDLPEAKPIMKSFNRLGPQYEVVDPVHKMVEESTKPTMEAMSGLGSIEQLFTKADELIPSQESPAQATLTGYGRKFGASDLGRLTGFPDENARSWNAIKDTFLGDLARSLSQERGVLTNQDIKRIANSIPTLDDSNITRTQKREFINQFIKAKIDRYNRLASMLGKRGPRQVGI